MRGATPERRKWHREVESLTAVYRERKACALDDKARAARKRAQRAGCGPKEVEHAGAWYASRARGQRWRFRNAEGCGDGPKMLRVSCKECGSFNDHPVTCGAALVCTHCRGMLQTKRRAMIANGLALFTHHVKHLGFLRRNRKGGRWSEKFVTLTIPHLQEHGIEERVSLQHRAWTQFAKLFNAWKREECPGLCACRQLATEHHVFEHLRWYGAHEWAPGNDDGGHPHAHFWYIGPYLPVDELEDMWRRSLEHAGFGELEQTNTRNVYKYRGDLIVNIKEAREVKTKGGVVYELAKYLVKDIVDGGELLAARRFAQAFEALDGRRLRRGSRGFIKLATTPIPCAGCHEFDCLQVKFIEKKDAWPGEVPVPRETAARGPPEKKRSKPPAAVSGNKKTIAAREHAC